MHLLANKTVLVTGASRGIGRAIALECARHGANLTLNVYPHGADSDTLIAEIETLGQQAIAVEGDVADPASADTLIRAAQDAFGRIDVLVNNAGICPFHSFLDIPVETVKRTFDVNLLGAYCMSQAAARVMVEQGEGGAIVAVSSISALVGGALQTHYTPTKAGVHSLMQSAAIALGPHGIRCNSVLPGTIETDINRDDLADPDKRRYMQGRIPLGRLGIPEDVAPVVVFLASNMARYVTGAAVLADGGLFVNLQ